MAENSAISWTHNTFNPWWGCTKVSPACGLPMKGAEGKPHAECYAKTWAHRMGFDIWGQEADRRFFGDAHWKEPLKWNRVAEKAGERRRVFCGSMCDVMEEREGLQEIREQKLYPLIRQTPWLDWLLLTKRPQNFGRFLVNVCEPLPNIWAMTTVESPEYLWRVDTLKSVPISILGLSIEPLLAPLPTLSEYLDGISWVIVGGESGPSARPMSTDWVRGIRDQCVGAGVAFHFKQFGEHNAELVKVGKKAAGRELDGREWNEFPGGQYAVD